MRYLTIDAERVVVRPSERDALAKGAVLLFVVPWVVAACGWLLFALGAEDPSALALAIASLVIGLLSASPALAGMITMATAGRRCSARAVVIDAHELIITLPGRSPQVLRMPERVVVRASGLSWRLETEHEGERTTLVSGVPYGSGRDLARAADALAEHLEVDARIPAAARRARGLIPDDTDVWAAICYAPLDGVNLAYSVFALMTSNEPRLRFAAKQSLALLALEGFLALLVGSCLGLPLVLMSLPVPLEALVLLLPLLSLGVARSGLRILAAVRAYRGRAWVLPVLAPLTRRWLPKAGARAPESDQILPQPAARAPRDTPTGDPFSVESGG